MINENLISALTEKMPTPAIIMQGKYCRLGAMHEAYAEPMWHMINEQSPGLGRTGPAGHLGQESWVERAAAIVSGVNPTQTIFTIFTLDSNLPIGNISIGTGSKGIPFQRSPIKITWRHTGTFIGSNWRRQGIGSEAKMLLLHWASLNLKPATVYTSVYSFNEASLRTQKKCGYREVRKPWFIKGLHIYRGASRTDIVYLSVATGRDWLIEYWNPYAEKHSLKIWDPKNPF